MMCYDTVLLLAYLGAWLVLFSVGNCGITKKMMMKEKKKKKKKVDESLTCRSGTPRERLGSLNAVIPLYRKSMMRST